MRTTEPKRFRRRPDTILVVICGYSSPPWPPSYGAVATARPSCPAAQTLPIVFYLRAAVAYCAFFGSHWSLLHNTTVPVHAIHCSLQRKAPSHVGYCSGVTMVLHTPTPLRHTTVTTVGIGCLTYHRGRCPHPQRPLVSPSCRVHCSGVAVDPTDSSIAG